MDREVRYRVLERKSIEPVHLGKTINMSSNGVLFTTDQFLNPGRYMEVCINWPAQLDSKVALIGDKRLRVDTLASHPIKVAIKLLDFRSELG